MADRFKPGDPVYVYPEGGGSFRAEVVKVPALLVMNGYSVRFSITNRTDWFTFNDTTK